MATSKTKSTLPIDKIKESQQVAVNKCAVDTTNYRDGLDSLERTRYDAKLALIKGQDPYEIVLWSKDYVLLPCTTYMDIVNYLLFTPSPYTQEELRCYKGLDAYNQFVSGWVRETGTCIVNDKCVVTAKVLHSQRLNEKPLRPWVIAKRDGQIAAAHCTCMAGLGETCTHVAALLFYIEAAVKIRDSKTCTEVPAYWKLPSVFQKASYEELRNIDFASAASMKKKFDKGIHNTVSTPKPAKKTVTPPDDSSVKAFLKALSETNTKPAVLSLIPEYSDSYVPTVLQGGLPNILSELHNENAQTLPYNELLNMCDNIDISVSPEQSAHVEAITREQTNSKAWFRFRAGRVTASRMKAVCRTNPVNPSRTLIQSVCYPATSKFVSQATKWGCNHEKIALEMFTERMLKTHDSVRVRSSGFIISTEYPHVGASPDATMSCDCCGSSPVEIKCPFCHKESVLESVNDKKFCLQRDSNNKLTLQKKHDYYYQIQTQLGICQLERAFLVVWTEKDLHIEEVLFDEDFWMDICEKSRQIFRSAILPELVGKFYSKVVQTDLPPHETSDNCDLGCSDSELYCYCRDVEHGSMIQCENPKCKFVWFHYECVGIK